jgi:hypothetical protein
MPLSSSEVELPRRHKSVSQSVRDRYSADGFRSSLAKEAARPGAEGSSMPHLNACVTTQEEGALSPTTQASHNSP